MWYKHREAACMRKYVGDFSICSVCRTDFRTRGRLIRHLLERRVRSKRRRDTRHDLFLASNPPLIEDSIRKDLEARDMKVAKIFRKAGHVHAMCPNVL